MKIKKENFLSLLLVAVMIAAAAVSVNKSIFGHSLENSMGAAEQPTASPDSITTLTDGTVIIHTAGLQGTIDGYAGPVPLDIRIKDGKISQIDTPDNAETPAFFKRASQLLSSWIGKTPEEGAGMKVDAVSGATYSSNAIISNMRTGLALYEGADAAKAPATPWKIWIALAVTLAACILPLFIHNKVYHYCQQIANIAVLGFWAGQFLDYTLILKYTSSGFVLPAGLIAIAMLTAAFIYPLFGRPQHYCNHICPLGSAQQLMAEICGYKVQLSPKLIKILDWFRRILWAALMLLLWTDTLTGWMDLELFSAFQYESASIGIIIAAALFILLSAIIARPYCRFICPTGSLFKRSENFG